MNRETNGADGPQGERLAIPRAPSPSGSRHRGRPRGHAS
jgi:hypothetical protein